MPSRKKPAPDLRSVFVAVAGEPPDAVRLCFHCELPLRRRFVEGAIDGALRPFCCFGCLLAMQVTRARGESGAAASVLVRLGLAVFFAMNVMMLSLPTYAPHVYGDAALPADGALFSVLRVLALAFSAPVLALLGWPILTSAARGLRDGGANMDGLIVLGVAAAFALSAVNTLRRDGDVYFDTVSMLLVLVTLGRYLEARAKADASAAVRRHLSPLPDRVERLADGRSEVVAPAALRPGDVVRVPPGAVFPTDGVVVDGLGGADESALTGESLPVSKEPGATVAGGTCSVDGLFLVRVSRPVTESAAARIAALLRDARARRAPAERLADRAAAVLVPAVVVLALLSGAFWGARGGFAHGLLVALAVLVVACPCGLGLATPVAMWTALAAAARRGVILRSAAALERLATVRRALLDKTGTLTDAVPELTAIEPTAGAGLSAPELLARAAALEEHVAHPLALRIVAAAAAGGGPPLEASDVRVLSGRGVRGVVGGDPIGIGSARFAREELGKRPDIDEDGGDGTVVVWLWSGDRPLGVLRFAEKPRRDAAEALAALRDLGLGVGVLSGDHSSAAVVPELVDAGEAAFGLLPEEKLARVRDAAGPAVMVGDGINDAPALAAAAVGIAVGGATDLTRMTADVAIVCDDLRRVPWVVAYARRVMGVVRQNLVWVLVYNAFALALAAGGRLDPLVASLAMIGSSLLVVANARRLRRV